MSKLRIAFCGNVANALFPLAQVLRAAGIDAHLFIDSRDPARWRPETDDPGLAGEYPGWIHEGSWIRNVDFIYPGRAPLIRELDGFDLVVGSGNTPMLSPYVDAPFVFYATGADLTRQPFPIAFASSREGVRSKVGHGMLAMWQRRGIRGASQIWTQPFAPLLDALDRLNVDSGRIADSYFPLIVDTDLFTPTPETDPRWAADLRAGADFVVLHPSRLVLDESPLMLRSGQAKGSASILAGFAEFVHSRTVDNPVIILPAADRGAKDAAQLVDTLGIRNHVVWAEAPRSSGFHRTEMVHLYGAADVTVNELGAGWFGWAALESMSCGVPVISRIDHQGISQLYGEDWEWIHASDSCAVATELARLAKDPKGRALKGIRSREWVLRHHAPDTAGERIVASVTSAAQSLIPETQKASHR